MHLKCVVWKMEAILCLPQYVNYWCSSSKLLSQTCPSGLSKCEWVSEWVSERAGGRASERVSEFFILGALQPFVMYLCFVEATVYPKKYAHGFCFAVLCCGYTLTDFPISIRITSLALWQSNDCPSASKATLMNIDKYFMWIHYERLHNHNKANHNKTVCIFLGIYCMLSAIGIHVNLLFTVFRLGIPALV